MPCSALRLHLQFEPVLNCVAKVVEHGGDAASVLDELLLDSSRSPALTEAVHDR